MHVSKYKSHVWQKVFARQLTFIDQKLRSRKTRVRITSNCSFKFTKHAIPYNITLMISKICLQENGNL